MAIDLSICIVNWNTELYLKQCLEAIYQSPSSINFELIVIDNDSKDNSVNMVKDNFPQVNLIINDTNTGFAKANNQAVKLAKGNFVLLLNPDIVIYPDVFKNMVEYAYATPALGALTCRILNPDGTLQKDFYRRFPNLRTVFFYFSLLGKLLDKFLLKNKYKNRYFYSDFKFEKIEKIEQAGASCLMIPKKIIDRIGIFDERFPIYFNDVDFCKRVWESGHEIHMLPKAEAIHFGGQAVSQLPLNRNYGYFYSGLYTYFKKHHGLLKAILVKILILFNPFIAYFVILNRDGITAANKKVINKLKWERRLKA